jgi:hypothetical protein
MEGRTLVPRTATTARQSSQGNSIFHTSVSHHHVTEVGFFELSRQRCRGDPRIHDRSS